MASNCVTEANFHEPLASVVIPAYNAERYIGETLSALLNQTLSDIEIICVDDGSTDGTFRIIQEHAALDGRIKVIQQDNSGAGVARNTGMAEAKGEWIAFLDADDIYRADFLEKMVVSASESDAELAICDLDRLIEDTGKVKPQYRISSQVTGSSFRTQDYVDSLFQIYNPMPCNKLFRYSYIRECGLQFQALPNCNDLFFTYAALVGSKTVAVVKEPLVTYRISGLSSIQDEIFKHPSKKKCLCVYEALVALKAYCEHNGLLTDAMRKSLEPFFVLHSVASTRGALRYDELLQEIFSFYRDALLNEWHVSRPACCYGLGVWLKYELMINSTAEHFAWVYGSAGCSRNGGAVRSATLGARALLVVIRNLFVKQK